MEWWVYLILLVVCTIGECIICIIDPDFDKKYDKKFCKGNVMKQTLFILNGVFILGMIFFGFLFFAKLCREYPSLEENDIIQGILFVGTLGIPFGILRLTDYWMKNKDDIKSRRAERKKKKNIDDPEHPRN